MVPPRPLLDFGVCSSTASISRIEEISWITCRTEWMGKFFTPVARLPCPSLDFAVANILVCVR